MNVIANNCVGARIYQIKKSEYKNPFMWSLINPTNFVDLINNYDNIDFTKIEVDKNNVTIDGKIKFFYPHYRYGEYDKPTRIGNDIFSKNCQQFITDRYSYRIKRMLDAKEDPIFVLSDKDNIYTDYVFNDYTLLDKINTKYRVILAGEFDCEFDKDKFEYVFAKKTSNTRPIGYSVVNGIKNLG